MCFYILKIFVKILTNFFFEQNFKKIWEKITSQGLWIKLNKISDLFIMELIVNYLIALFAIIIALINLSYFLKVMNWKQLAQSDMQVKIVDEGNTYLFTSSKNWSWILVAFLFRSRHIWYLFHNISYIWIKLILN